MVEIESAHPSYWRKCNECKKQISYRDTYYVCNVSTCNRKRTGLVFCQVSCWDAHLPGMNHREAWAIEQTAPSIDEWREQLVEAAQPRTRAPQRKAAEAPISEPIIRGAAQRVVLRRSPK